MAKDPCDRALDRHADHLVDVPLRDKHARLAKFHISQELAERMVSLDCIGLQDVGRLETILTPLDKEEPRWRDHIHRLEPRSLDDLKDWVGIPNAAIKRHVARHGCEILATRKKCRHHLPSRRFRSAEHLDTDQRKALRDTAFNLLYGPVEEELVKRSPYREVVEYMLSFSRHLHLFCADNLIVCPGETVTFRNFAVLCFNNVVVYRGGQINVGNNVKLHAHNVKHV